MAVPLAQISLNIPPALVQNGIVSGISIPRAPANPPNPVDVKDAVKLKAAVGHELVLNTPIPAAVVEAVANYETDVILARQIALAPPPAPGLGLAAAAALPAPAAPMAGVALILNAIAASNQALNGRLNDLQREIAIVSLGCSGVRENSLVNTEWQHY
ncbi:hypothetical protein GGX14DRAFT_381706 [Mycena pura]|uniref:Uncharacterized protein n=1 Tax=Mycena pura TaxID=153505 RepID=A0AAD6US21_9AGAR|nr:hypothetical protein GGX14DRAFT_381706 [Mycena pura]